MKTNTQTTQARFLEHLTKAFKGEGYDVTQDMTYANQGAIRCFNRGTLQQVFEFRFSFQTSYCSFYLTGRCKLDLPYVYLENIAGAFTQIIKAVKS